MEDKDLRNENGERSASSSTKTADKPGKTDMKMGFPLQFGAEGGHSPPSDHSEDECSSQSNRTGQDESQRGRHCSTDSASGSEEDKNGPQNRVKDSEKRQRVDGTSKGFVIPGLSVSPPRFVSLEQIMKAANGVTNMALAHEIAVDKDFKLERIQPPEKSLEKQVKDIIHQAFWDAFQSQLEEQPPNYNHGIVLLNEIKENVLSLLLPHHTKIRDQINEVLDIELIKQQAENNTLEFHYYAQYVISIMSKLCAPVRDDKIRELMVITDVVPMYREILQLLDLMKLDMANFTIQQMRPHIQQHSIEYEKEKFAEFLQTQEDGLEYTRIWLKRTMGELYACSDESSASGAQATENSSPSSSTNNHISSNNVIIKAYMGLLEWNEDCIFPETLVMDQGRFLDLRDKVNRTTLIASLLLVTFSTVGQAVVGLSEFKQQLKQHIVIILGDSDQKDLSETLRNIAEQIGKEVSECLEKHGFSRLTETNTKVLKGQIETLVSPDSHIRKLVHQRLLEFIGAVLASTTASPVRIPPGLSSMQPELALITGQFLRLVSHNRAVFGDYYVDIISSLKSDDVKPVSAEGTARIPPTTRVEAAK